MSEQVAEAYDALAERYAQLFLGDLIDDVDAHPWIDAFVELVGDDSGVVLDLGCGPGHGVDFLCSRGVPAIGVDMSTGLLAQARARFPSREFRRGDLTALDEDDSAVSGIHSRYSIIHIPPAELGDVFAEWARVLAPSAPVLISFFASTRAADHGRSFDHKVATAYELFPDAVGDVLGLAGFTDIEAARVPPPAGARPLDKGTVLARRERT